LKNSAYGHEEVKHLSSKSRRKEHVARPVKDEHEQMTHYGGHADHFHVSDVSVNESGIDAHSHVLNVNASEIESDDDRVGRTDLYAGAWRVTSLLRDRLSYEPLRRRL